MGKFGMELRGYKFNVEYKKGSENVIADGLSRLPLSEDEIINSIMRVNEIGELKDMESVVPTAEELSKQQLEDSYCKKVAQRLEDNPAIKYIDYKKGMLRINERVIVPESLIFRIIYRYHAHQMNSHLGAKKTIKRLMLNYTFPKLAKQVYDFIATCAICQKRKATRLTSAPLKPINVFANRWTMVNVDLVGPLEMTYKGNKYILMASEYLTKYIIAVPIPNKTAKVVARAFIENVILKFECIDYLISDLGNEFEAELFKEMCAILKIKKLRTVAYKPSTNGKIESFNRTLGDMLASILGADGNDWDSKIPFATYSYNTSVHEGTNFTPHYLQFGMNVREPEDLWLPRKYRIINKENEEFLDEWKAALYRAKDNLEQSQLTQKKYFDRKSEERAFNIGDLILLKEMRIRYKFNDRFLGPYVVLKVLNDRNYVVKRLNNDKEIIVNINRMKLYRTRDPIDGTKNTENDFRLEQDEQERGQANRGRA